MVRKKIRYHPAYVSLAYGVVLCLTRRGWKGKEGTGMDRLNGTRQDLGIAELNWGNRCNSERCEKRPFITLNQRVYILPRKNSVRYLSSWTLR